MVLACAVPLGLRLADVPQAASETIAGSEADAANRALERAFGEGAAYPVAVVLHAESGLARTAALQPAAETLAAALTGLPEVRSIRSYWNSGDPLLLGRDGRSAILLVETTANSIAAAEALTATLRRGVGRAHLPSGYVASVTGTPAMFHDLNRNSAHDLRKAEIVGIPLTLLILVLVFRSPIAACLPLALAGGAVALTLAALLLLHEIFPVSIFAQNAVTMIGLGAGVDYALFVLYRFRAELARGIPVTLAVLNSSAAMGPAVAVSGAAVGIGFLALFLVHASFLRSLAIGGLLVVGFAVALSLTLLPLALAFLGERINWPGRTARQPARPSLLWALWARRVMAHPWAYLVPALGVIAALALPALRTQAWNVGVTNLPAELEARRGYEALRENFAAGWMGPVAVVVEAAPGTSLREPAQSEALRAIAARIARDPRVAAVDGEPQIGVRGDTAVLLIVPHEPPEARSSIALVKALRSDPWPEARARAMTLSIGGAAAMMIDFDAELFGSLWRVVPAVLAVTLVALVACFRSLVVPLKAVCANLISVIAAYGFLVLVFQDGIGAQALAIDPPGGLNSFIVLMLFTILFGLSMDYEVFLLRSIQEERRRAASNEAAVAAGLARSAGLITSAAAIMVCLFASFGLTELTATREFGLGLAVAVAVDASIIRLVVIPALMRLLGEANWWFPGLS
jgi:RND superfamily putative drug exporter